MIRELLSVSGEAEYCGPCVLSAVTGLPSETWPDQAIVVGNMEGALTDTGYRVFRLRDESPVLGQSLAHFCHPRLSQQPDHLPFRYPQGLWVIVLGWPDELEPNHVAAVEVYGRERFRRRFVDNHFREPTALSHVVRHKEFSKAFVARAWLLR